MSDKKEKKDRKQSKYHASKKRYVTIPHRVSGATLCNMLRDHYGKEAGDAYYNVALSYFDANPRKTCCHIRGLEIKIRKYGTDYTIEEA